MGITAGGMGESFLRSAAPQTAHAPVDERNSESLGAAARRAARVALVRVALVRVALVRVACVRVAYVRVACVRVAYVRVA